MLAAHAPGPLVQRPASRPTPTQTQATWATIFLFLAAFWYGVGVGVHALWSAFVG